VLEVINRSRLGLAPLLYVPILAAQSFHLAYFLDALHQSVGVLLLELLIELHFELATPGGRHCHRLVNVRDPNALNLF